MQSHNGVVLHIMAGTLSGTDSWFHNPKSQASAHFGVGKTGTIYQWVDTDDKAWAEVNGNPNWISIENEGKGGDSLTQAQIDACAKLFEWADDQYHFGLQVTSDVNGKGLGHHSMGGAAWGGHFDCPGDKIIAQKPAIIAKAKTLRSVH